MTKQLMIEQTIAVINKLPENKIAEMSDFIINRYEYHQLTEDVQQIISTHQTFNFLHCEEELHSEADIKEKYND